jgi:hypothetical protein
MKMADRTGKSSTLVRVSIPTEVVEEIDALCAFFNASRQTIISAAITDMTGGIPEMRKALKERWASRRR